MTLVARLKVTLSDVEPEVLRRFDVPVLDEEDVP